MPSSKLSKYLDNPALSPRKKRYYQQRNVVFEERLSLSSEKLVFSKEGCVLCHVFPEALDSMEAVVSEAYSNSEYLRDIGFPLTLWGVSCDDTD